MPIVDTQDGGVTLAESGFVMRWHPDTKTRVVFGPLNSSLQTGLDTWDIEAVFPVEKLFDVWLGKSQGFNCDKVVFALTNQGLAFRHIDGLYSGGFWDADMHQLCKFINANYIDT